MIQEIARKKQDFAAKKVGDELVLVPIRDGVAELDTMFTLNDVGCFIWENIEEGTTEEELCRAMVDEFDVSEETATADLKEFLGQITSVVNG